VQNGHITYTYYEVGEAIGDGLGPGGAHGVISEIQCRKGK